MSGLHLVQEGLNQEREITHRQEQKHLVLVVTDGETMNHFKTQISKYAIYLSANCKTYQRPQKSKATRQKW